MTAPNQLTAAEAIAQLGSGTLTAGPYSCLPRPRRGTSGRQAWIWLDPEQALAEARRRPPDRPPPAGL